jgi:hypothetical protein
MIHSACVIFGERMTRGQPGFWDSDDRFERLSAVGDPLEKLKGIIPWPVFEKPLANALKRSDAFARHKMKLLIRTIGSNGPR